MRLAILGTGLLGSAIAERLQGFGHEIIVWNRTRKKTEPLVKAGAMAARSPAAAVEAADAVLLVLADAAAIRKTLLSRPVLAKLSGKTVVQMGTIAPGESSLMAGRVGRAGGRYLEAPVLGSITEARSGTLLVMAGASPDQFEEWLPVFRQLSQEPVLIGPVGKAAALKLALNQLIAAETAAFALSLALVQRHDIDAGLFMKILRKSALYALTFDKKLPRLLQRNYKNPNFSVKHMLKDVELILKEARAEKINASGLRPVRNLLAKALHKGCAQGDYCALFEAVSAAPRR